MGFLDFIVEHADLIAGGISTMAAFIYFIVSLVRNRKRIKAASTDEEKQAIYNEIKVSTIGFVNAAENLFSDIPKSGASKLLYVLKKIESLCTGKELEYDPEYWTNYVNSVVSQSNAAQDDVDLENQKISIIKSIKSELPYHMTEADKLFEKIPDNYEYKVKYLLSVIKLACEKYTVNVYEEYDWMAYIETLYKNQVA